MFGLCILYIYTPPTCSILDSLNGLVCYVSVRHKTVQISRVISQLFVVGFIFILQAIIYPIQDLTQISLTLDIDYVTERNKVLSLGSVYKTLEFETTKSSIIISPVYRSVIYTHCGRSIIYAIIDVMQCLRKIEFQALRGTHRRACKTEFSSHVLYLTL